MREQCDAIVLETKLSDSDDTLLLWQSRIKGRRFLVVVVVEPVRNTLTISQVALFSVDIIVKGDF